MIEGSSNGESSILGEWNGTGIQFCAAVKQQFWSVEAIEGELQSTGWLNQAYGQKQQ